MINIHRGSSLDDFLEEDSTYDELKAIVTKEAVAFQLENAMSRFRQGWFRPHRSDGG